MNFFEQQEHARRLSSRLLALFILALGFLILALYGLILGIIHEYVRAKRNFELPQMRLHLWEPRLFFYVATGTLAIVLIAMLWKMRMLSKGGAYLAEQLGGRLVDAKTCDLGEKKLMNIVEEMAIASGMPVPGVYVLDAEIGLNAFAAGFSPQSAAVVVTRGCLVNLTRDELQGVIAHEFSHILNGDMRLNLRLIGVLAGITFIGNVGYFLMSPGDRNRENNAAVVGLGLYLVGSLGLLFGRMIQAAISRQREFLADASAVQFTRNPLGIAGALKKIGGTVEGSRIASPRASEVSHMFFALSIKTAFDTHPPLTVRIKRVDPSFQGQMVPVNETTQALVHDENLAIASLQQAGASGLQGESQAVPPSGAAPAQPEPSEGGLTQAERAQPPASREMANQAGKITPESMALSADLLQRIPPALRQAQGDALGAVLTVFALLLDNDDKWRKNQLDALATHFRPEVLRDLAKVYALVSALPTELRLPLIELAAPALRLLSSAQRAVFLRCVNELVMADGRISLFEFSLQRILESLWQPAPPAGRLYRDISEIGPDMVQALAMLARAGTTEAAEAEAAFGHAVAGLPGLRRVPPLAQYPDNYKSLNRALNSVATLASPKNQKAFIDACCACVLYDNKVTIEEAELLRAFVHAANIPFPPLQPTG